MQPTRTHSAASGAGGTGVAGLRAGGSATGGREFWLVIAMAPNPINLYGLVIVMAPNLMNLYGLVLATADIQRSGKLRGSTPGVLGGIRGPPGGPSLAYASWADLEGPQIDPLCFLSFCVRSQKHKVPMNRS